MARTGSAILSSADIKGKIKSLRADLRTTNGVLRGIGKTRKELDKQEGKLTTEVVKIEAKIAALTPKPAQQTAPTDQQQEAQAA